MILIKKQIIMNKNYKKQENKISHIQVHGQREAKFFKAFVTSKTYTSFYSDLLTKIIKSQIDFCYLYVSNM